VVDHFLLPRLFGISRPLTRVPAWSEAGKINVPAFVSCLIAIGFGAYATHLFTFLGENSSRYWGPAPLEAWAMAGVLYVVGVAVVRAVAPARTKELLGFDRHTIVQEVPPNAVIDIASVAGLAPRAPMSAPARTR
jgi:cytosine permease